MASNRLHIRPPGEYYADVLKVEAWLKRRSMAEEATNLLCSKLLQRTDIRDRILGYVARKRGISPEDLFDQIVKGEADYMDPEDYRRLAESEAAEHPSEDAEQTPSCS